MKQENRENAATSCWKQRYKEKRKKNLNRIQEIGLSRGKAVDEIKALARDRVNWKKLV